jgi:hypothetical protein
MIRIKILYGAKVMISPLLVIPNELYPEKAT